MLSESVWHRQDSPYLRINYEMMQLFDFDQYMALVTSALANLHSQSVKSLYAVEKPVPAELWFSASKRFIRICCMGMVSARKIDCCLDNLIEIGYLKSRPPAFIGGDSSYCLDVKKLNGDLAALPVQTGIPDPDPCPNRVNGYRKAKGLDGTDAVTKTLDGTDADDSTAPMPAADGTDAEHKVNSLSKSSNPIEEEPPTPLPEESKTEEPEDEADLQLNVDNISEWVQDLFHEKTGRQFSTIMGKDRGRFVAMAEQDGAAALKRKIEAFIDSGGKTPADFLRKMPGAFPKTPMRREPEAGRQVFERRLAVGQGGFGGRPQPSASKSQIGPRPHTDQTRGLVLRWNGIVTSRPAAFEGNCGYAVSMLEQMQMDAEFMTGFDEICQKAQKIITAKGPDDATWLTFGWLFKTPDGGAGQNWGRLFRGELDWMAKSGKSGGSAPKFETQQKKNNRETNELIDKISRGEIKI